MKLRRALLSTMLLLSAPLALADDQVPPDVDGPTNIHGHWSFQSETYQGCAFSGTAYFNAPNGTSVVSCELTARQSCVEVEWVVRQSCTATRTGDRLTIESQIEEFLVGEPSTLYWPDNFVLKIRSEDQMTGRLISHGSHPTVFVRRDAGVS